MRIFRSVLGGLVLGVLLGYGVIAAGLTLAGCYYSELPQPPPPVAQPPPVEPPPPPPQPFPPPEPPPPSGDLPALGTAKAAVEALWGKGADLPENPGEDDSVSYIRVVDGREAEVHVIYRGGVVFRVVVSVLVGGG